MSTLHPRLQLQLRRAFGAESAVPAECAAFVQAIDAAYRQFDDEHAALTRALDASTAPAGAELARLNRLYATLSGVNRAVVRARSSEEVLAAACRLAVEQAGFPLAWIGWSDEPGSALRPVARAGAAQGYVDALFANADAARLEARGPTGLALREKRPVVVNDFAADAHTAPWREAPARFGLAAGAAFPLRSGGEVRGVFSVYSAAPGGFGEKEAGLLEEIADDVSFALENLENQARHRRTQQHNHHLATIVDSSQDAIVSRDLANVISSWNKAAERIYGYSAEEMIGHSMDVLVPSDRQAEVALINERLSRGEGTPLFETVRRHKDGREVHVEVTVSPLRDAAAKVIGAGTIAHDITERKRLQAQFLRAQRLESIGTLASGIAHDLNNILAPLLMGVPMLRRLATGAEAQTLLDTMEAAVQRGANVIRQILVFARGTESRKVPLQSRHVVREVADILEQTFPKSIVVKGSFPRALWPVVADATELHQVFMNLCVNARDAMPGGGTLTLAGDHAELDAAAAARLHPDARPGRYVVWTVADTGTGIAPEHLDRIFEPFFTTKAPGHGTGLGLSTMAGIVRSHGGFVQVTSRVGAGTTFAVHLPASAEDEKPTDSASPSLPRGQGELVLLVDDEFPVRQMAAHVLTAHNYRVLAADSGGQGLAEFHAHAGEIALLITDLVMPGMSGAELIRMLRPMQPQLKVVAISGLIYKEASGASQLEVLADGFLQKPFSPEALLTTVASVLAAKRG